jgi:hypothetical protein
MKKIFFLVVVIGLTFASCSKDEIAPNNNTTSSKDHWNITQKGVYIEGVKCNQLTNEISGQFLYEAINEGSHNKQAVAEPWTHSSRIEQNNEVFCDGPYTKNCFVSSKGEVVIKRKSVTN